MSEKTRGLILRETNLGEADKILTVLTENDGKISVLAKNIRRVKGRFGAGAAFLCFSDFELEPSRNELYYLKRATPVENFFDISKSIEKLALAAYFGQLASMIIPDCFASNSNTLNLLLNTFYVLANFDRDLKLIKSVFELRLMAEEGYAPDISGCKICGRLNFPLGFEVHEGAVRCINCAPSGIHINENVYKAMYYILNSDMKKLFSFDVGEDTKNTLSLLSERYCLFSAGREIPALDYLKSLI